MVNLTQKIASLLQSTHARRLFLGGALLFLTLSAFVLQRFWLHAPVKPVRHSVLTVDVVQPSWQLWPQNLPATGALSAWQEAVIGTSIGNVQIAQIFVDVGSRVSKGQLLAQLTSSSLLADVHKQQALVALAQANHVLATANAKRARQLKNSGALSKQQIQTYLINAQTAAADLASAEASLESSQITLGNTRIEAVDDGVISSRSATLGAVVTAGGELFRLIRQGRIEWQAEVDAAELALIQIGQKASLQLPNGHVQDGIVRMKAPTINANTGRALVYVQLPLDTPATAGDFASGYIELGTKSALTLPQTAIVLRDGRSYVFLLKADQTVSRQVVTTGRYQQDRVEVLTGINPSTPVIAAGGAFLSEGALVSVNARYQP